MRIKDTERLLASHDKLISALQFARGEIIPFGIMVPIREQIQQFIDEATKVRTEIGRPLNSTGGKK